MEKNEEDRKREGRKKKGKSEEVFRKKSEGILEGPGANIEEKRKKNKLKGEGKEGDKKKEEGEGEKIEECSERKVKEL